MNKRIRKKKKKLQDARRNNLLSKLGIIFKDVYAERIKKQWGKW